MADKQDAKDNAEETLITLDQLSQTLEVMSCVVERLKSHLDRQMSLTAELFGDEQELRKAELEARKAGSEELEKERHIVEISHQELEEGADPVVH